MLSIVFVVVAVLLGLLLYRVVFSNSYAIRCDSEIARYTKIYTEQGMDPIDSELAAMMRVRKENPY